MFFGGSGGMTAVRTMLEMRTSRQSSRQASMSGRQPTRRALVTGPLWELARRGASKVFPCFSSRSVVQLLIMNFVF
jgi:hypothetical protein